MDGQLGWRSKENRGKIKPQLVSKSTVFPELCSADDAEDNFEKNARKEGEGLEGRYDNHKV